jgi:hypothetical protein
VKNFTERRKDGPKTRAGFEKLTDREAAKSSRRVALLPDKERPASGGRGSGPGLFVYIIRPFFFCLGQQYGYTLVRFAHTVRGGTFAVLRG